MNAKNNPLPPSRGYLKIAAAAQAFHFDFRGKTVLDIGSSTGGFTHYALDHGARWAIAVEKGTKQMVAPLRFDSRVELHEKTDIFHFTLSSAPDVVLADVSFVPLTQVLSYAAQHLADRHTDFLVMFKPQFAAAPSQLQNGVVKNSAHRRQIIKNFETWLKDHHFLIRDKRDNHLPGKAGNLERFYWLKLA